MKNPLLARRQVRVVLVAAVVASFFQDCALSLVQMRHY
jgi:hypothetical protein